MLELVGIDIVVHCSALLVLARLDIVAIELLLGVVHHRCGIRGTIEQRTITILVAIEHREQCGRVVGLIRVHWRIDRCTNGHRGIRREAEHNHSEADSHQVHQTMALAMGDDNRCTQQRKECKDIGNNARVDWQTERVDKEDIDHSTNVDGERYDDAIHKE